MSNKNLYQEGDLFLFDLTSKFLVLVVKVEPHHLKRYRNVLMFSFKTKSTMGFELFSEREYPSVTRISRLEV